LAAALELDDPFADIGTDALDIAGGDFIFSVSQGLNSANAGRVEDGDLISESGQVLMKIRDLLASFSIEPAVDDAGLDAIQYIAPDEYYFSIKTNLHSQSIGADIFRGDILSSKGRIIKTRQQLISALQPLDLETDTGLDAFYIWPHGEVWFSTERGFDTFIGPVSPGDIVSDRGYIVFRNLNLLQPFAPREDASNFGLDALMVITDAVSVVPVAPNFVFIGRENNGVRIRWDRAGKASQLEKATFVTGPYAPISPIIAENSWFDPVLGSAGFYRVRRW
jgi:hypothetical protein